MRWEYGSDCRHGFCAMGLGCMREQPGVCCGGCNLVDVKVQGLAATRFRSARPALLIATVSDIGSA